MEKHTTYFDIFFLVLFSSCVVGERKSEDDHKKHEKLWNFVCEMA